jgi:probable addiction module antidote protein
MKTEYAPFDASSHLDNEEVIAEYLTAAAEDEDQNVLLAALANVAKARGMARIAEAAGLGRESLYKTLAPGSHPRFETIRAILRALNVEIAVCAPLTDNSGEVRELTAADLRPLAEVDPGMMAVMTGMRKKSDRLKAGPMASPRLAEEIIKRMKAPRADQELREEPAKPALPAKKAKRQRPPPAGMNTRRRP